MPFDKNDPKNKNIRPQIEAADAPGQRLKQSNLNARAYDKKRKDDSRQQTEELLNKGKSPGEIDLKRIQDANPTPRAPSRGEMLRRKDGSYEPPTTPKQGIGNFPPNPV